MVKRDYLRRVIVFEDHYKTFRKTIDREALKKLYQVLLLIMTVKIIPAKFLKTIEGRKGLYEVRSEYRGNIYRVFCCFDENDLVVLLSGFQKKSQKTPTEQLDKAEALMKKYFDQKNK